MATISDVTISTSTGIDGNSYTSAVSNDKLTNEDFLQLMLTQLKLQDPTSPMDSNQMLETQMQMSQMNTNIQLIETLSQLSENFGVSSLSASSQLIGSIVQTEDGSEYLVSSIEKNEDDLYFKGNLITGMDEDNNFIVSEDSSTGLLSSVIKVS